MRAFISLLIAIFVAIGVGLGALAATDHTSAGAAATAPASVVTALEPPLDSLLAKPGLELDVTGTSSGGSAASPPPHLRLVLDLASTSPGVALRDAGNRVQAAITLDDGAVSPLVEARVIGNFLYFRLALGSDASTLGPFAVLSGKWYHVSLQPRPARRPAAASSATAANLRAALAKALSASSTISGLIGHNSSDIAVSGSLGALAKALDGALSPFIGRLGSPGASLPGVGNISNLSGVSGTYDLRLHSVDGELRHLTLVVTGPNKERVALDGAVNHQPPAIVAPTGSVALSRSIFAALGALGLGWHSYGPSGSTLMPSPAAS